MCLIEYTLTELDVELDMLQEELDGLYEADRHGRISGAEFEMRRDSLFAIRQELRDRHSLLLAHVATVR